MDRHGGPARWTGTVDRHRGPAPWTGTVDRHRGPAPWTGTVDRHWRQRPPPAARRPAPAQPAPTTGVSGVDDRHGARAGRGRRRDRHCRGAGPPGCAGGTGAAGRWWAWRRHAGTGTRRRHRRGQRRRTPACRSAGPARRPVAARGAVSCANGILDEPRGKAGSGPVHRRGSRRTDRHRTPARKIRHRRLAGRRRRHPAPTPGQTRPPRQPAPRGAATGTPGAVPVAPAPPVRRRQRHAPVRQPAWSAGRHARHGNRRPRGGRPAGAAPWRRATGRRRAVAAGDRQAPRRGGGAATGGTARSAGRCRRCVRPAPVHRHPNRRPPPVPASAKCAVAALPDQAARVPACRRRIGPDAPCARPFRHGGSRCWSGTRAGAGGPPGSRLRPHGLPASVVGAVCRVGQMHRDGRRRLPVQVRHDHAPDLRCLRLIGSGAGLDLPSNLRQVAVSLVMKSQLGVLD